MHLLSRARSAGTVLVLCCSVLVVYLTGLRLEAAQGAPRTHRWISDDYDRDVFYRIAQFVPQHSVPYLDVPSEYPTLATLAFAAPFLGTRGSGLTREAYRFRWSVLMAIVLAATVYLVATFRIRYGLGAAPALLLLLPSPLYFSLMRFDILCALLVCASLAWFCRGRYRLAHFVLGLATFVKWYPAVLFPVYVAFHLSREPVKAARYGVVFVATVGVIGVASIWAFTWDGFLVPYLFHAGRGGQYFNLYRVMEHYRPGMAIGPSGWRVVNAGFFALELSIVLVLLFKRIRSLADVLKFSILAIYLFITFARIDSPQWMLWYVAPALMFVRDRAALVLLACLGVWNYLVFPVAFDVHQSGGMSSRWFSAVVLVKDAIVLALLYRLFSDPGPDQLMVGAVPCST
jgi:hypothetical protein